ncbi:YihY family inner membrane protein [bacterium]|nr:YihY family inner membrane protein [bacterium]
MARARLAAVGGWLQQLRRRIEELPAELFSGASWQHKLGRAGAFVYMVVQGFIENRCPVRAAALSYTTLIALVPLLAVVIGISKNFLHDSTAEVVPQLLDRGLALIAPALELMPADGGAATPVTAAPGQPVVSAHAREQVVAQIQGFIDNINGGALTAVGSIFLLGVALRLLNGVEQTFNDIWGIAKGRSIWRKVVYYWTTITLGPLLLVAAVTLTGSIEFSRFAGHLGIVRSLVKGLWFLLPFFLLWIGFTFMYMLMPNTRVPFRAAFIGGVVGGTLWQLNSLLSTLYVSRVVTYSKIYGSLGILPLFLVGLYFSWLVVLFGAQIAFAAQNLHVFLQQHALKRIDQDGRELIACRIVLASCRRFLAGKSPPQIADLAEQLRVPSQLINQLVHHLAAGGLLVETAGDTGGVVPARPPESITPAEVLRVMRRGERPALRAGLADHEQHLTGLLEDLHVAQRDAPANLSFRALVDGSATG